jgi:hypothetical protein
MSQFGLHIESDAWKLLREFSALPKHLQEAVQKGLKRALILLEELVRRRADLKFAGSRSGLSSRLTSYVEAGGALVIDGVIGFRKSAHFPYELSHEYGAMAKAGGAMVVPVSAQAKALSARGLGPKDMAGVKLFIPRGGHVLAAYIPGSKSIGIQVQYILIKTLRPRLHFRENVMDNLDIVENEVIGDVKEALAS